MNLKSAGSISLDSTFKKRIIYGEPAGLTHFEL